MGIKVYDQLSERLLESAHVLLADRLLELKKTKSLWEVIAFIVDEWIKSSPTRYDSFLMDVKEKMDTRTNKYGSNKSKTLRYTLDIPSKIYLLIRVLYEPKELQMDKKFLREFARRFPKFKVAEKI